MTNSKPNARLGATAIAAVLALSSTPLLAQQATSDTTQPAASTIQPTDIAPAATPAPSDTAPAATPDASTAPDTSVTTASVRHTTVRRTTVSTASPAAATPPQAASRTVTTHHATHVPAAAPAAAAVPASTAAPAPAAVPPLAQVAGPPPAAAKAAQPSTSNRTAEIAGAALFALIVLGAIAFALARRRRTRNAVYEEEYSAPEETYAEEPEAEPVAAAAPIAEEQPPLVTPERSAFAWGEHRAEEPVAAQDTPSTTLPSGFDLSRFGPHVQAAYRGPTEDNPSLSLRHRLRRAAAMDQMERNRPAETGLGIDENESIAEAGEFADA